MSTKYLTHAERFEAAIADIEDVPDELFIRLTDAHVLVEHLAGALAECGIQPATHPEIALPLGLLRRLLAADAVPKNARPTLGDIAERVHLLAAASNESTASAGSELNSRRKWHDEPQRPLTLLGYFRPTLQFFCVQ